MSDALTEIDKASKDEVVFMARYGAYKLVRKPRVRTFSEVGTVLRDQPGTSYKWRNGVLRVRPGRDVMVDSPAWLADGEDEDKERDVVEALKAHRDFGKLFWIDGEEPNKPRPFEKDVLRAMNQAVARVDLDQLQALLDAERGTHNRPLLTGALTSAIESVSAVVAEIAAQESVPVAGDGENALEWSEASTVDELQEVAERAGVEVEGTGANGNVLKEDLVKALRAETEKAQEKKG